MIYHTPVLVKPALEGLNIISNGTYVDATFGGGGHSRYIINKLGPDGRLYGFDQDKDATQNAIDDQRFCFIQANFRYILNFMNYSGVPEIDGILADLGVSSYQFDTDNRGFSYRHDTKLDMRMNTMSDFDARSVLNEYDFDDLVRVFSELGELRNAKSFSRAIVEQRKILAFENVNQLLQLIEKLRIGNRKKYYSQVFQAIRMEVNDEVNALKDFLRSTRKLLRSKGRLVVISYHSVEDRLVKQWLRNKVHLWDEKPDHDHKQQRMFRMVNKQLITPAQNEIRENPRSRSAKMRIGERL